MALQWRKNGSRRLTSENKILEVIIYPEIQNMDEIQESEYGKVLYP